MFSAGHTYEHKVGPRNDARVVARAWVDHAYKSRLLTNSDAAIAELGYRRIARRAHGGGRKHAWRFSLQPQSGGPL